MNRILIIEDDEAIRDELCLLLTNEGYQADAPEEFDGLAERAADADLILLDLTLPGKDGFALCREIRKTSRVPVIFVTSRDNALDELKALQMGGDDYITKPYNVPVLLARIKAVLRRKPEAPAQEGGGPVKGLRLDLSKGLLIHGNVSSEATRNEIKILTRLMSRPGEIVSRADLIEYLWDNQIYIDDNTLSVNITRLRAKLTELGLSDYISTRRGMGYVI
jgi:DNA-binding response OmpR family regulator